MPKEADMTLEDWNLETTDTLLDELTNFGPVTLEGNSTGFTARVVVMDERALHTSLGETPHEALATLTAKVFS